MKTLCIAVKDKIATYNQRGGELVCENSDYQIAFTFDAEWDSMETKTARFVWNGQCTDVMFTGSTVTAPVVTNADQVEVGVYAGDLHTTTPAVITCKKSILSQDPVHVDPPEDVYNQIMDVINDHRMFITVVEDSTGAFTADATNTRYVCTAEDATEITFDPPAEASEGDQIIVEFHSGATPTTLTLVSTNARYNFKTVPANAYFEINAMYTAGKWSVFGAFIVD